MVDKRQLQHTPGLTRFAYHHPFWMSACMAIFNGAWAGALFDRDVGIGIGVGVLILFSVLWFPRPKGPLRRLTERIANDNPNIDLSKR